MESTFDVSKADFSMPSEKNWKISAYLENIGIRSIFLDNCGFF